jgi:ATP-dependent protease Clp ATPase subunit
MECIPERLTSRWRPPESKYVLADQESANSFPLVDLLIKERRLAVVEALLELATTAQQEVVCEPDNTELQDYACSLAWHYVRLRDCKRLDSLIREAMTKKEQAERLAAIATSLQRRFDCVMAEVENWSDSSSGSPVVGRFPCGERPHETS